MMPTPQGKKDNTEKKKTSRSSFQEGHATKTSGSMRSRWLHLSLFLIICLVYLCTISDMYFYFISDGRAMFETAVSLHEFGEFGISTGVCESCVRPGLHDDYYSIYGLGQSVVDQLPLLIAPWVEKTFGEGRSTVLFPMTNMLLTALTGLLIALCLEEMGYRFRTGALAAVVFAFATPAWCYVSYDFSEPTQSFWLVVALWSLLRGTRSDTRSWAYFILTGTALGFAVLTKAVLLVLIPGYAIYLWTRLKGSFTERVRSAGWFVFSLALFGGVIALLNDYRFGSIFQVGYVDAAEGFSTPLIDGLYRLLLGPNKGLLFYAPVALLLPFSLWILRKSRTKEVVFFLMVIVPHVVVNSMWWSWEGGASWGPRLILPLVPLMMICVAMSLESRRWTLPAFVTGGVLGAGINLLGILVYFVVWPVLLGANHIRLPLDLKGRPAREYAVKDGKEWFSPSVAMNYLPALSPIRGHLWILRLRYLGIPFPLGELNQLSPEAKPKVSYPPVEINFGLIDNKFVLTWLRSPHFWLWRVLTHQTEASAAPYPAYGASIEHQGDRAAARGNHDRALQCYQRAMRLMPNSGSPVLKLARLEWDSGGRDEAKATLLQYLAQKHGNVDEERSLRAQLAQYDQLTGDREGELEQYKIYLTLHPSEENRLAAEKRIAELTAAPR